MDGAATTQTVVAEGLPPEAAAAAAAEPAATAAATPEASDAAAPAPALPPARKAGWLEMKLTFGWSKRFMRVERGDICRWHEDVTLSMEAALRTKGLDKYEPKLAELGVASVPAMSKPEWAGADAARLTPVGMDAAELARFVSLAAQWKKSIATFQSIDLRTCSLGEVDGRKFSLIEVDGTTHSFRGSVPGDAALWVQAVKDELAELEATAGARQSVSQMNTEITDLLELLTADSDTAWSDSELAQMQAVISKADLDMAEQIVRWLALRLQIQSTPIQLKTLNLVITLASASAPAFCRAVSRPATDGACTVAAGVLAAQAYTTEPHSEYGDKPQQLVRSSATKCAQLLDSTAADHTPKKPRKQQEGGLFSKMSPVVNLAWEGARHLFDSPDAAEERELERLEELIRGSNRPLFAGDRVRYSEGRVEGMIQSITTLDDGRVTCKVRLDGDQESGETLGAADEADTAAADEADTAAAEGDDGIVRTYFLQDLYPIPKVLWEPRRAHIKSLSKGAKSGHVSLGLESGMLSLNSRELCFATDDGWTTTSLPWHMVKGGAAGVAINRKAVDIPAGAVAAAAPAPPGGEPEPEPEPEPAAAGVLKTVVVLCTNRAICPQGKLEVLLPEALAIEFESHCQAAAGEVAAWCSKLIAEDGERKQAVLVEAGLVTAAAADGGAPEVPEEGEEPTAVDEGVPETAAAGQLDIRSAAELVGKGEAAAVEAVPAATATGEATAG